MSDPRPPFAPTDASPSAPSLAAMLFLVVLSIGLFAPALQYELVYAAAGTPDTVFPITPTQLVSASGATVCAVATS